MSRAAALAACLAAASVGAALRLVLVLRRDPDVDELFTVWLVRKDLAAILQTLSLDSGPPLYYAIAGLLPSSLTGVRMLSIVAAIAALAMVIRVAGAAAPVALLALYPHHLYFSSVARAYALVALLIGISAVLCDRWVENGRRRDLIVASAAILAAAYSHYYGVYFFPLPFVFALIVRRALWRDGFVASALLGLAFVPGFLLMRAQPEQVIAWMRIDDGLLRLGMVAQSVLRIGFDGRQPLPFATSLVQWLSAALLLAAAVATRRSPRAMRYLLAVLVPIGGAVLAAACGMTAYFPIRFESVLSVPVVLWFWFAADAAPPLAKRMLVAAACVIGVLAATSLLTRDWRNSSDIYQAALFARDRIGAGVPIVATGPSFLETAAVTARPVVAFPSRHAVQPWDETYTASELARDEGRLPRAFLWIGDVTAPPFAALRGHYDVQPVARFGKVIVATSVRADARTRGERPGSTHTPPPPVRGGR